MLKSTLALLVYNALKTGSNLKLFIYYGGLIFAVLFLPALPVLPAAKGRDFAGAGGKRIYRQNSMYTSTPYFGQIEEKILNKKIN